MWVLYASKKTTLGACKTNVEKFVKYVGHGLVGRSPKVDWSFVGHANHNRFSREAQVYMDLGWSMVARLDNALRKHLAKD